MASHDLKAPLRTGDVFVYGGEGPDSIRISNNSGELTAGDDLYIYGDEGTDLVELNGIKVSDKTYVNLGTGTKGRFAEVLAINNSIFQRFIYNGSTSEDLTRVSNSIFFTFSANLANGNDRVEFTNDNVYFSANCDGGYREDTLFRPSSGAPFSYSNFEIVFDSNLLE